MNPDPQRNEDCRFAVRHHLAVRGGVAQDPSTIRRHLNRGGENFTLEEVGAACRFLVSLGHATEQVSSLGTTRFYQATAAGILADERGDV